MSVVYSSLRVGIAGAFASVWIWSMLVVGCATDGQPEPADPETAPADGPPVFLVINGASWNQGEAERAAVLQAAGPLVGGDDARILDAGEAYQAEARKPLEVEGPSEESTAKARWLREWLARRVTPGSTIVLLGDEKALPTWRVDFGRPLTSDSFYTDLDGDGVPESAVCRVLGRPELQIRQLRGKKDFGHRAVILCSEDTRIHQETRAFARALSNLGYEPVIRGARDDATLTSSDIIVHFGHGSPTGISNRFGETFVSAADMPPLPRSPIVFVDGCGTLPVGSPLLHAFLEQGALAYLGSTETVQGMIPARFTNELVEHFLRILRERPDTPLPRVLVAARAAYIKGHPGLAEKLKKLADTGEVEVHGDEATHVLTVAEWVYYGDPLAVLPRVRPTRALSREVVSLSEPVLLTSGSPVWKTSCEVEPDGGQAVLALRAEVLLEERSRFGLAIRQNGKELALLDGGQDTVYQNIGQDCRGGYASGEVYRARFLLPLKPAAGDQELEVTLASGSSAVLEMGTGIEIWPPDFEKRIGLRHAPDPKRPRPSPPEPVTARGKVSVHPAGVPGFSFLDLASVLNRPHDSMQVGGGDNASFKTWFSGDRVEADGVPFRVRRTGKDVLVSANNRENLFELQGVDATAKAVHLLVWGYNRPRSPATLLITFTDGSTQECEVPLEEWTEPQSPAAFDFENTVQGFRHAAIFRQGIQIDDSGKKIARIASTGGTYGLIAVTLEE